MIASKYLREHVTIVDRSKKLGHIKALMHNNKTHHVCVMDQGKIIGIISDKDVIRHQSPKLNNIDAERENKFLDEQLEADQIMTPGVTTIKHDMPITKIIKIMLEKNVGAFPVLDENHKLIGIVSKETILESFKKVCHFFEDSI